MGKVFENCKKIHEILLKRGEDEIDEDDLFEIIQNVTLVNESTAKRYLRDLIRFGFLEWKERFSYRINSERKIKI